MQQFCLSHILWSGECLNSNYRDITFLKHFSSSKRTKTYLCQESIKVKNDNAIKKFYLIDGTVRRVISLSYLCMVGLNNF